MWRAFDLVEPIGDSRADLAAGVIASTIANANRGRNQPAFKATDFMPLMPAPKELPLAQQVRNMLRVLPSKKE